MRKLQLYIFTFLLLCACTEEGYDREYQSMPVVEGWIEDGGFPVVMLSRSLFVTDKFTTMDDLSDYILRWAKVTVVCDTDSVVLTGKYDKGYFPPYVYTTSRLRGEAGKKYKLTVEYRDYYATAETTIPQRTHSCDFFVTRCSESDTLYQVNVRFVDNPTEKNYYQLFTRVGTASKQYLASYLGSIDDAVIGVVTETPVYRGRQLKFDYRPYFSVDDTVSVKLSQVDETSFRIWDSYTKTLSLSSNMFLSTFQDMETNIIGGYGYWCGYASVARHIIIRDSIGADPAN